MPRNVSSTEHPFSAEREYIRALNAAKLSRMMAKPFIGCLTGTTDTMTVMSLNTEKVGLAVFGTFDGKVSQDIRSYLAPLDTVLGYRSQKINTRSRGSFWGNPGSLSIR